MRSLLYGNRGIRAVHIVLLLAGVTACQSREQPSLALDHDGSQSTLLQHGMAAVTIQVGSGHKMHVDAVLLRHTADVDPYLEPLDDSQWLVVFMLDDSERIDVDRVRNAFRALSSRNQQGSVIVALHPNPHRAPEVLELQKGIVDRVVASLLRYAEDGHELDEEGYRLISDYILGPLLGGFETPSMWEGDVLI